MLTVAEAVSIEHARGLARVVFTLMIGMPMGQPSAATLWQALVGGQPDVYLRYRFETVDDGQQPVLDDAYANTLRTAIGYSTGLFHDVGAYVQLEDVRVLGDDDFNDGGHNHVTSRATVVDPEGTELQQAKLRYQGFPETQVIVGRQEIEHRPPPLNRYVGNISWRQNWQTFDAVRVVNESLPATRIDYAWTWNVNRIFGEDNHLPDRADYDVDGHLIDLTWQPLPYATVEPYAYLLDFDGRLPSTDALSTATLGARVQGTYDLVAGASTIVWAAEFAYQEDYGEHSPVDIAVTYTLGDLGISHSFAGKWIESMTIKTTIEVLGGDGSATIDGTTFGRAFQTPLATTHPFQGWANRFLTTPADGVVDVYGTLAVKAGGMSWAVVYHDFDADRDDYDYGTEWDAQVTRAFRNHCMLGAKFARYEASGNALNLARNGAASTGKQAFDLGKFWLWAELRY